MSYPFNNAYAGGYGQPGYVQTGFTQPGYVQTGYTTTGFAQPGVIQTGFAQPGVIHTSYTQPGFAHTGFAQPGIISTGFAQPGFATGCSPFGYSFQSSAITQYAAQAFQRYDFNRSGTLDRGEASLAFGEFCRLAGIPIFSEAHIQQIFTIFDVDGNQNLTFGEFRAALEMLGGHRPLATRGQTMMFRSTSYF